MHSQACEQAQLATTLIKLLLGACAAAPATPAPPAPHPRHARLAHAADRHIRDAHAQQQRQQQQHHHHHQPPLGHPSAPWSAAAPHTATGAGLPSYHLGPAPAAPATAPQQDCQGGAGYTHHLEADSLGGGGVGSGRGVGVGAGQGSKRPCVGL